MSAKFDLWLDEIKQNRKKIAFSLIALIVATAVYLAAGEYVNERAETVVSHDLILDHIGPYNLSLFFIWLYLIVLVTGLFYPFIFKPREFHYVITMFSFLVIVRSFFIIFTHLAPPAGAILTQFPSYINLLSFTNDLFFSGHTAFPFFFFLLFREHHKGLSIFMLVSSVILAITVLLMHLHYSIDVFSAYFISYGVYRIGHNYIRS